jgi:hypothetical protein
MSAPTQTTELQPLLQDLKVSKTLYNFKSYTPEEAYRVLQLEVEHIEKVHPQYKFKELLPDGGEHGAAHYIIILEPINEGQDS